jgi:hypothetical protein
VAITTYAELQTALAGWLNRADLTGRIPDFIALCEARLGRHEAIQSERRVDLTLATEIVTLPTGCREILALRWDDGTRHGPIEIIGAADLPLKKVALGETGVPQFGAIVSDGTELLLAPAPDQTYVAKLLYIAALTPLSNTETSNWVLANHPDVYLLGSLVEAEPYLLNDERMPMWKSRLDEGLEEIRLLIARRRTGGGTPVMRPSRTIGEVA